MNLSTDRSQGVVIIRVGKTKLMYPMLSDFSAAVSGLVAEGESKVVINMSQVSYVDSASIGCLMDLISAEHAGWRLSQARGCSESR